MAIVKDPVARARRLSDGQRREAAQLHVNLETELGLNPDLPPEYEAEAEEAIGILESRFGGADGLRELSTDRGLVPSLSRGAQRAEDGPSSTGSKSPARSGRAAPAGGKQGRQRSTSSGRRRSSRRRSGSGSRTLDRTGLPGAADTASGLALQLVGVTVALVLLFVLVRPRAGGQSQSGAEALTGAARVFVNGLRLVIAPTDPLAPKAGAKKSGGGLGAIGGGDFPALTTGRTSAPGSHSPTGDLPHGAAGAVTR